MSERTPLKPPTKCPECDGALLVRKNDVRCVRCGPLIPEKVTFQELLDRGDRFAFDDSATPCYIHIGRGFFDWNSNQHVFHKLFVGGAGVIFRYAQPSYTLSLDEGTEVLLAVSYRRSPGDVEYWSGVRSAIFELLPEKYSNFASWLWKCVRTYRMRAQARAWDEVLPDDIVAWANAVLFKASEGDDCVDNFRVARVGNTSQQRRYRQQKENGCCGSEDFIATGPDGNLYRLGYNYGH